MISNLYFEVNARCITIVEFVKTYIIEKTLKNKAKSAPNNCKFYLIFIENNYGVKTIYKKNSSI